MSPVSEVLLNGQNITTMLLGAAVESLSSFWNGQGCHNLPFLRPCYPEPPAYASFGS